MNTSVRFFSVVAAMSAWVTVSPAFVHGVVIAGPGHMDINMNIDEDGQWTFALDHDGAGSGFEGGGGSGAFTREADVETVIYIPGSKSLNRPSGSTWDFFGVGAGQPLWIFGQNQDQSFVWPGLNTEETTPGLISTWRPDHPLLTAANSYMELRLTDMQYYGEGTANHFSMWIAGAFGSSNVWMSTANGIDSNDAFFMLPGGHSHMNWGFTSQGIYDLTFVARTMLDGEMVTSDPFTLRFGINATSIVPEPGRVLLLVAGCALMFLRRRR
ncbi:PEP-CTERM sorting domain-containing protein [Phragmitibacter flavus]|uniref:PEP-CTERM sorting domain-containing protein n=1 Tax=Phragmitibacter flavus TaxID=2576071 RepID=A0A5R8KIN2_9BACT|nr:choice-of-anchor M domain-containing protein [Phragmitibacter flavus]TLD72173.1 PEP-CTERM sorting domain-containing protein [Phragmitibacter flavus]